MTLTENQEKRIRIMAGLALQLTMTTGRTIKTADVMLVEHFASAHDPDSGDEYLEALRFGFRGLAAGDPAFNADDVFTAEQHEAVNRITREEVSAAFPTGGN